MNKKAFELKLIKTGSGYNYWMGADGYGKNWYNVTPIDQPKPGGGYTSPHHICGIKKVPNLF